MKPLVNMKERTKRRNLIQRSQLVGVICSLPLRQPAVRINVSATLVSCLSLMGLTSSGFYCASFCVLVLLQVLSVGLCRACNPQNSAKNQTPFDPNNDPPQKSMSQQKICCSMFASITRLKMAAAISSPSERLLAHQEAPKSLLTHLQTSEFEEKTSERPGDSQGIDLGKLETKALKALFKSKHIETLTLDILGSGKASTNPWNSLKNLGKASKKHLLRRNLEDLEESPDVGSPSHDSGQGAPRHPFSFMRPIKNDSFECFPDFWRTFFGTFKDFCTPTTPPWTHVFSLLFCFSCPKTAPKKKKKKKKKKKVLQEPRSRNEPFHHLIWQHFLTPPTAGI